MLLNIINEVNEKTRTAHLNQPGFYLDWKSFHLLRLFCSVIEAQQREKHKTYGQCKYTSKRRRQINMFQNECKYMQIPSISRYSIFFLNLWSFKIAGGQTASCLKFMKHLFNSPGRDLSWQPFTFTTRALLVWHSSGGPQWTWCMFHDGLLACIIHIALLGLLWSGG